MKNSYDNERRDLVIVCSNTMFDENPLGAKPLAIALQKTCNVIYVDPPFSIATAIKQSNLRSKIFATKYKHISKSLLSVTPLVLPGKDRPIIYKITSWMLMRRIRKAIANSGFEYSGKPILIATAPHYRLFFEEFFNIYWMMDDYASQPELTGIDPKVLKDGQEYQCQNADKIITVSDTLSSSLEAKFLQKTQTVYNGADDELFRFPCLNSHIESKNQEELPTRNFAIYAGGVNDRVDLNYLKILADANIELVIVGARGNDIDQDLFEEIISKVNVYFLGPIKYENIPAWLNLASVGLVPYKKSLFNEVSMPLKIPEYLLCGLPVVSSDLPFTKSFENDDVEVAVDENDFLDKVRHAVENPPFPSQRVMRSSRIAQDWSWGKKASEFID